ncbi:MAG: hypothetical protein GY773_10110 [Actinomycetia bacterium]|nr:hypothetical protein [Actinomycetes bacterium]
MVEQALFEGYHRVGGDDGAQAQTLAGLPVTVELNSQHPRVLLDDGSVVVAEYLGAPGRWVPRPAVVIWDELGGAEGDLGVPMANVNFRDGRLLQAFAGGFIEQLDGDSVRAQLADTEDAAMAAEELVSAGPGLVRLYDETAYYVTDSGERQWVPTAEVWFCLGGEDALLAPDRVDGWVVARLPTAGNAEC